MAAQWGQFDSEIDPSLKARLDQLRQAWGRDFRLNSGYRDPRANAIAGGVKNSQHLHGKAVDIDTSGWSEQDRQRFISTASKLGFGGVGVYDNALHFDVGPRRAWGKDHTAASIPMWSRVALDPHLGVSKPQQAAKPIEVNDDKANAFDEPQPKAAGSPESGVYGFGQSVAPDKDNAFSGGTKWGSDHYGRFIDWGSGGRSYA